MKKELILSQQNQYEIINSICKIGGCIAIMKKISKQKYVSKKVLREQLDDQLNFLQNIESIIKK